ncbi:hypothetical protein BsWGS_09902 [Bradybaena similaris]
MDALDKLKAKYKLSAETEHFLKLQLEQQVNGDTGKIEKEDSARSVSVFSDKIVADFDGNVKQFAVPSAGVPNGVPISVIKPKDCARRPGILINFHGNGHISDSRHATQALCMLLARELKCVVVDVDYRLAPEHKFPSMFDDGKAVVRWVLMNKSLVGGENDSKVGVLGAGAGGGIALTIAFEVPGIDYEILVYPLVDWSCQGASFDECEFQGSNFNLSDSVRKHVDTSLRSEADKTNVRASPVLRKDFTPLPPTLLLIAEVDPLKDSNYEFKSKMKAANVVCDSKLMKGAIHGFFSLPGQFPETNQRAREIIGQFYKKHGVC